MKVRALTNVFLENVYYKEGQVLEYYGPFNRHLEPVVTHDGLNWLPMTPPPADWAPPAKKVAAVAEGPADATAQLAGRIDRIERQVQAAVDAAEKAAAAAVSATQALAKAERKPARRRAG